ncbi:universal stress protein [Streptomyces sp. UNOC14_S4]|uniref:universal stress protein n=1 Tax=Streptomyces sp. UNOC14_S4 TaxID=2872340 RepID=UPI001E44B47E|nr:universal stress protein [Streptomyces sp. UNOC14_S4]MCC3766175.1 universal stress protein [Streptomyces sp. UNOC14_S4]
MDLPVIVGTDGSRASLEAVDWAADAAVLRGSPLWIVHAGPDGPGPGRSSAWASLSPARAEEVCALAADRAALRSSRLKVTAESVGGGATMALLEASHHACLVVVGHRGQGGGHSPFLGPVATAVVAHAHCPAVVVRGRPDNVLGRKHRVSVGVGRRHPEETAVSFAFAEAALRRCEVETVFAWSDADSAPRDGHRARYGHAVDGALRSATRAHPEVPLLTYPVGGPTHTALLRAAAESDLLVLGARPHGSPGPRLGMVNGTVLQYAQCPVAVVPR